MLQACGIHTETDHTRIINFEGLSSIEDFAQLESDKDVDEMAKHLGNQPTQKVHLGVIQIKKLQALVFWV